MSSLAHKRVLGIVAKTQAALAASPAASIASASEGLSTSKKRQFDVVSSSAKGRFEGIYESGGIGVNERIAKRARLNASAGEGAGTHESSSDHETGVRAMDLDGDLLYLQKWEAKLLAKKEEEKRGKRTQKAVGLSIKSHSVRS